ncbi:MAG: hypothetical protein AB7L90_23655 [Hyphomicrobiaceae bacterium]
MKLDARQLAMIAFRPTGRIVFMTAVSNTFRSARGKDIQFLGSTADA